MINQRYLSVRRTDLEHDRLSAAYQSRERWHVANVVDFFDDGSRLSGVWRLSAASNREAK